MQSALKDIKSSLHKSPYNPATSSKEPYKYEDRIRKLNDMVTFPKPYSMRGSTHHFSTKDTYPQKELSFRDDTDVISKLELVERKLEQLTMRYVRSIIIYSKCNHTQYSKKVGTIDQARFSYVLKTVESNIESLVERIQR